MVIEARLLQRENAADPMLVTLSGIIVVEQPNTKVLLLVSIIALHPSRESYIVFPSVTMIEVRELQHEKAASPMLVVLMGIVSEIRLLQNWKA